VSGGTRIIAVAGDPVAGSLSPVMHNAAITALGLDAVYVAARTTAQVFPALVHAILTAGGALNVTAPFKFQAATLPHEPSDEVRLSGVCNTIWGEPDHVRGDNTDIAAVREAVLALLDGWAVQRARIAGTGATARSAAIAVTREWPGATISVHSRAEPSARAFIAWAAGVGIRAEVAGMLQAERRELDISTTPPGTGIQLRPGDRDGLEYPTLELPRAYLDLNYARGEPAEVRHLRRAGVRTADGRGVLVLQGAASFERFFGVRPPLDIMRAAVEDALRP
jgi:shikimate dehydrogenase